MRCSRSPRGLPRIIDGAVRSVSEPLRRATAASAREMLALVESQPFRDELLDAGGYTIATLQETLLRTSRDYLHDSVPTEAYDAIFAGLLLCGPIATLGAVSNEQGPATEALLTNLRQLNDRLATARQASWEVRKLSRHLQHELRARSERIAKANSDDRLARVVSWLELLVPASAAIAAVESRVTYIVERITAALRALGAEFADAETPPRVGIAELERFAQHAAAFAPKNIQVRAVLARLIGLKYAAPFAALPNLRSLFGWDEEAVRSAYRAAFGCELSEAFAESASPLHISPAVHEAGWLTLHRGEVLCKQDDPGDRLYYLAGGRLRVAARDAHGAERTVGEVSRGEFVGEISMLTGEPRSASVYAARESELLVIDQSTFDRLQSRETLRKLTAQVAARMRRTMSGGSAVRRRVNAIAVVPASRDLRIEQFCDDLTSALRLHGSAASVSGEELAEAGYDAEGAMESINTVERLEYLEMEHTYVVYRADAQATAWTRWALRKADLILLVAAVGADGTLSHSARVVLETGPETHETRCDLVLLGTWSPHAGAAQPKLYGARPAARYHIDPKRPDDLQRLARYIVGRGIGLVLGGGAARGFAAIGVMRALEELRVPVDLVCGTSMGAIIAAAIAMGWTSQEMLERLRLGPAVTLDMSLPFVSMSRGIGFRKFLARFIGDIEIADLRIPFFCASANLTRAELKIHTSGSLLKAVMASNAAPAVFPPVVEDGDLLVDGGLLANVPSDAMRALPETGPVIVVDVVPPEDLKPSDDYGLGLSGWRVLAGKVFPWVPALRLPSLLEILLRAQLLASLAQIKHAVYEPEDLLLALPLSEFSLVNYKELQRIADRGYELAAPAIARWKATHEYVP